MRLNNHTQAFFALVRAGLWGKEARLSPYGEIDYEEVMRLAEEQAVIGLVTAGLEHVTDVTVPMDELLNFIGSSLQIEESNKAMNSFIHNIVDRMQQSGINTTLIKGQGVAQCYEKPLWRANGDVDFFMDEETYNKAKEFLIPLAEHVDDEHKYDLHQGMTIDGWAVELHGSMRTNLLKKVDSGIDMLQRNMFMNEDFRMWMNDGVNVPLPSANNDVIFVFTHFVSHFYGLGVGLRQICDWCRLLWTYRDSIDRELLELRIKGIGLLQEWQAFAAFAIEYLGMPVAAMPLININNSDEKVIQDKVGVVLSAKLKRKSSMIKKIVMETGNFGYNIDQSYRKRYFKPFSLAVTFFRRLREYTRFTYLFPKNAPRFFIKYLLGRFKVVL